MKFGRLKPYSRIEKPRLILDWYLDPTVLPKPHAVVDRASNVLSWPMYLNDSIGDCTCACMGHMEQAWTAYASTEVTVTDHDVLKAYEAVSGYDPATGANDNGANIQDVLNYWRRTGVGNHRIQAFAQVTSLDNWVMAKQVLELFGSIYLGINVPQSAMDQFSSGLPWTWVHDMNIVGGHAVPVQFWGTDMFNEIAVVTWGRLQHMNRAFWRHYVEEAWVVFTPEWLTVQGTTIDGFDLEQLKTDFQDLTGSTF